ncbi:hypothetical protein DFS34DRAFT_651491 [Phlyctochytrium arcticum]|nr:hypothetical protein DFS34DRAFT_651491 [Phlyctochytrium arcticum]
MVSETKEVSRRDENVLNFIFNPDAGLPDEDDVPSEAAPDVSSTSKLDPALLEQLKRLEAEGVLLVEKKETKDGLAKLTEAINLCRTYASAYNNRAQAYRLDGKATEALADLELAILHGAGNPTVLKQAFTQRAIIRKAQGDETGSESDFAQGARYGNEIAKAAVKNNPYAKMCNTIVLEAMSKLHTPQ